MAEDGRPPRQDPALDVSASAKVRPSEASCKFTLTIASERVAMLALAVAGAGVGVCALTTLWYKRPEAFKNAVSTAVGALGARVCKIWSGSIFVELCCDTKESLLSFVEAFEAKKVKQRLEEEFRKIGFAEKLEVTITDEKDVYEKVNKIR